MNQYINGQWIEGSGNEFASTDPVTNEIIWQGRIASQDEVSAAVNAAKAAFISWKKTSLAQRETIIRQFGNLLKSHQAELAQIISQETGKPLWEAKTEITSMINKIGLSIEAYYQRTGMLEQKTGDNITLIRHRPHGVMCVLGPFNFPGHLPNGHIVPALLAGNTIVFKPSSYTPLIAIETVKLWEKAGLPIGVLNLIQGNATTGESLVSNPVIDGLCFTGSYEVGVKLHQKFSLTPEKIIALEMGGNNPLVIANVKNIPAAVYQTILSAFISAGQRCTCARRLILPFGPEGDNFLHALITMSQTITVGHYTHRPEPFMGSLISGKVANAVLQTQEQWLANGAQCLLKMTHVKPGTGLVTPGIIDTTHLMRDDNEVFAPLLQVIRVNDFDSAIKEANHTSYGLSAGLISDDQELFNLFSEQIEAGVISWNRPSTGASSQAPFGGIKRSGNHRPSAWYAADYCSYPVACQYSQTLELPSTLLPGLDIDLLSPNNHREK